MDDSATSLLSRLLTRANGIGRMAMCVPFRRLRIPHQGMAKSDAIMAFTVVTSLVCLLFLGGVSAKVGGARVVTGALRVALWSAVAMGVTSGVGALLATKG